VPEQQESKHASYTEFIRNKIRSGEWPPGHKLPSQAMWAAGTPGIEIKYGTLRGVYITLKTEGWIAGQQGEGVYVAEKPPCKLPAKSIAQAQPGTSPFPAAKRMAKAAVPTEKRTRRS